MPLNIHMVGYMSHLLICAIPHGNMSIKLLHTCTKINSLQTNSNHLKLSVLLSHQFHLEPILIKQSFDVFDFNYKVQFHYKNPFLLPLYCFSSHYMFPSIPFKNYSTEISDMYHVSFSHRCHSYHTRYLPIPHPISSYVVFG